MPRLIVGLIQQTIIAATGKRDMNTNNHAFAEWDPARWFVTLSPLIGVLLGFLAVFVLNH